MAATAPQLSVSATGALLCCDRDRRPRRSPWPWPPPAASPVGRGRRPAAVACRRLCSALPRSAEPPARSSLGRPSASRSPSPMPPLPKKGLKGRRMRQSPWPVTEFLCPCNRKNEDLSSVNYEIREHPSHPPPGGYRACRRRLSAAPCPSLTAGKRPLEGSLPPQSGHPSPKRCPTS